MLANSFTHWWRPLQPNPLRRVFQAEFKPKNEVLHLCKFSDFWVLAQTLTKMLQKHVPSDPDRRTNAWIRWFPGHYQDIGFVKDDEIAGELTGKHKIQVTARVQYTGSNS